MIRERNQIVKYLKDHTIQETIEKFKISKSTVYEIIKEFNLRIFKNCKIYNKEQIAEYLKEHTIKETLQKFKISRYIIHKIVLEFNIPKLRKIHNNNKPNYQIIALIQNTDLSYTNIAKKINCTTQNVSFIAGHMRDNGIKFIERN